MTDHDRLIRAAHFCHTMSYLAIERGSPRQYETWRKHAKAYTSAARIVSKRNHRTLIRSRRESARSVDAVTDGQEPQEAMRRMVDGIVQATEGHFDAPWQ